MKYSLTIVFLLQLYRVGAQVFAPPEIIFFDDDVDIASSITTGDMNGDGTMDVLMTSADYNIFYLPLMPDGTYGEPVIIYNDEVFGTRAYATDVDSDGDMDVVAVTKVSDYILLLTQDDEQVWTSSIIDDLGDVEDMILADVDSDGDDDLVASTFSFAHDYGAIVWYANIGDGLFGGRQIMTDQIERVYTLHMADFDNDARLDVLVSTRLDGGIYYIRQGQDGNFLEKVILDNSLSSRCSYAQDMDGDGDVDVVIANTFDVVYFDNKGDGTFDEGVDLAGLTPFAMVASDVDRDGDYDLIVGDIVGDRVVLLTREGNGSFSAPETIATEVDAVTYLHAADSDGDGDTDLFMASSSISSYFYLENISMLSSDEGTPVLSWLCQGPNPVIGSIRLDIPDQVVRADLKYSLHSTAGQQIPLSTLPTPDGVLLTPDQSIHGLVLLTVTDTHTGQSASHRYVIR